MSNSVSNFASGCVKLWVFDKTEMSTLKPLRLLIFIKWNGMSRKNHLWWNQIFCNVTIVDQGVSPTSSIIEKLHKIGSLLVKKLFYPECQNRYGFVTSNFSSGQIWQQPEAKLDTLCLIRKLDLSSVQLRKCRTLLVHSANYSTKLLRKSLSRLKSDHCVCVKKSVGTVGDQWKFCKLFEKRRKTTETA